LGRKNIGIGVTESGVNEPRSRSVPSGIGAKDTKEEGRKKKKEENGSLMIPQIYPVIEE
jgi:hypothetical protein